MLDHEKINKLIELSTRACSINEELIKEERNYLNALSYRMPIESLKSIRQRINELLRKEVIYAGAALRFLERANMAN